MIKDYLNKHLVYQSDLLKNINNIISKIGYDPNDKIRDEVWFYCMKNKIDILSTEINNTNKINNFGYSDVGFITQLFSIFKRNKIFCMKEEKISICQICYERKILEENFHDLFLIIDDYYIKFKSIKQILLYQLIMEGTVPCNRCDFGNDMKTAKIYYNITEYPTYLFILFDLKNHDNLKEKLEGIKRLTKIIIRFSN